MDLNFNSRCRACLAENETMLSLFDVYEHELTLAMILQACISTEVSENDGLPSHLCDNCILILTQFYNFTVVYEESEKKLHGVLKKNRKFSLVNQSDEVENSENMEEAALLPGEVILGASNEHLLDSEDITESGDTQDETELYEFKNVDYAVADGQVVMNNPSKYEGPVGEVIQDFKREIISAEDVENVDSASNEYFEIHVSNSEEIVVKQETKPKIYRLGNPSYEEVIKYECTVCGEAHLYASSFQQHMRVKHHMSDINCKDYANKIQIKVPEKPPRSPTASAATVRHEQGNGVRDNSALFLCDVCEKKFHSAIQLQQHSKLHDLNKKYVCEVCGARFIRKTYLDDHREGHSTEKKHVCKFCGKAFRRRTVLRAHKRVHTHPNHYVCEQCGRAFTNSSTLKTHRLLIHVRERNFQCVICNLTFPLKSTLNKHVLRHQKRENGEKGFNCTQCEMQYRDKSSLKRHIETKHQGRVQLIPCPDCPKKYTSKANLMKHRRRHHSIAIEVPSLFV